MAQAAAQPGGPAAAAPPNADLQVREDDAGNFRSLFSFFFAEFVVSGEGVVKIPKRYFDYSCPNLCKVIRHCPLKARFLFFLLIPKFSEFS